VSFANNPLGSITATQVVNCLLPIEEYEIAGGFV
jgi:hypothetical protein